ncbi:PadR family transcriptional regulator [Microbacterium sp. P5_E9]
MRDATHELSNEVSFWVLTALSEAPKHGYAILRDVELLSTSQGSPVTLKIPTLYGALERLNRMELIEVTSEEVVDGRARRYYRLTELGAAALEDETVRLEARVRVARSVMPASPSVSVDGGRR